MGYLKVICARGELFFTETFSKSSERIIIDHFTVHLHYP